MYKRQAKEYENIDDLTWKITLNDGVVVSNGRACDGEAVKECLESLIANHERAAGDLCIDTIEADGNTIIIKTTEPKPALINYLSDPYGCIIDVQAGITDNGIAVSYTHLADVLPDMHYVRIVLIQEKRFMNRFLSETGNKVQAHKGVFWLIEDKLLTFPFEKNRYQSSVSKSGDTYVHK